MPAVLPDPDEEPATREQGGAGSGQHRPRKGEQPHEGGKHEDTGEPAKREPAVHNDTVPDAEGTAKYPN